MIRRRTLLPWTVLALAACTGDESKTIDSADGAVEEPRRTRPPYEVAPVAESGSITGTVAVPPVAPAAAGRCAGRPAPTSPVVVYLEDIPRGLALPQDTPRRYQLAVDDCAMTPAVSIAAAGGTLNLSNGLRAVHHVEFVHEGTKGPVFRVPFSDPGQLVPSEKVLSVPGLVEVQSDLDPSMRARLVVVEHPYAVAASGGNFSMDSVPPGSYTLVAVGAAGRAASRVDVRAGAATTVALTLQ